MSLSLLLPLLAMGAVSGLLAGLLGVGGGLVLVPMLTYLLPSFGIPNEHVVHCAIGTALGVIFFTSLSSLRAHQKTGAIRWDIVQRFVPGLLVGGLAGSRFAAWLPTRELALFFGFFVIFSAFQMLLDRKPKPTRQLPGTLGQAAMGAAVGALSSIVGAGGGFLSVPFMVWCNVHLRNAVATSAAMGFPIAAFSAVGYVYNGWHHAELPAGSLGYIYVPALASIASVSVLTAPVGAGLAHRLPVPVIKPIFAVLLFGLAGSMLFKGF